MAGQINEYKSSSATYKNVRYHRSLLHEVDTDFVGYFNDNPTSRPSGNEGYSDFPTIYAGLTYKAPDTVLDEDNVPSVFYQVSGRFGLSSGAIANRHFNANYIRLSIYRNDTWATYNLSGSIVELSEVGFDFYFHNISFPWWFSESEESYLYLSENGDTWYYGKISIEYKTGGSIEIGCSSGSDTGDTFIVVDDIPEAETRRYVDLRWLIYEMGEKNGVDFFKSDNQGTYFYNYTYNGTDCICTTRTWDGTSYVSNLNRKAYNLDVSNGYFSNSAILEEFNSSGTRRYNLDTYELDSRSIKLIGYNEDGSDKSALYPLNLSTVYKFTKPTRRDQYATSYVDSQTRTFDASGLSHEISLLSSNYTATINWKRYTGAIVYDGNGNTTGNSEYSVACEAGVSYTMYDGSAFKKKGYTFNGWATSPDGSGDYYPAGSAYVPHAEANEFLVIFYAVWELQRYPVYVYDLQVIGGAYQSSYIHYLDTAISNLPASISREGYTFRGYSLDSTENMKIADTKGKLIPNVADYTNSSGQYLLDSPLTLFALWERIEFKISFNANGGVIAEKDKVKTTYEGKVLDFPKTSRAGYMLSGWTEDLNAEEKTFVTESTIFSGNTSLYADWEEVKVTSEALCYLERVYEDTIQRFYLPIISNIEDTISASLVEMDTVMFGYENRFVMDTGTKQSFSVTVERVAPVNPDDSGTDFERFSNSKWWALFLEYINFWQNDGRAQNGERTGGFRFVYAPQEEYKELYPTIVKNVFISGQVSVRISVDHMSFTLPLTVATMDAKASLPTWKAIFKEKADSTETFESEEIVGSVMSLPTPDSEWVSRIQREESKGFSHWVMESGDSASKYYPGGDLEYDSDYLTEPPVFYAVWVNTSETRVYYVTRGESRGPLVYEYVADADCTVEATLYGGGGTGGKGSKKNRAWPKKDYYPGGGGGGAPVPVTTSYAMKAGEILYIELGLGGNSEEYIVDEYWTPPENDGTVSRTWMYDSAKTDSTYGTKGVGGVTAGIYNGGKGGDVEDGNKMNAGEDGKGSMGGKGAEGLELKAGDSKYFAFYGGGGGGGSIPYVKREEFVCNGITYKTAYQYSNPNMSLYLNDVLIEVSSESVFDIISKGGDGGYAGKLGTQACDAMRGYADLGEDTSGISHRAIFVAAGGGGRLNRETKSDTHYPTTLPMSRGSDGFVILNIMKG